MDYSYDQTTSSYLETNALFLLPDEKAVLTTRQHVFAVIPPIIIAVIFGIGGIIFGFIGSVIIHASMLLTLLVGSMFIMLILGLITKILIDWYFHLYLVTNKRILEIAYKPFFSQDVNDVLLDQVRCTEIDVKIHGYIHGLFDIGDIIITFDRPTHQQEFVLHDIKSPRKNETLLGHLLNMPKTAIDNKTIWYKSDDPKTTPYVFTEEIMPTPIQSGLMQRIQVA